MGLTTVLRSLLALATAVLLGGVLLATAPTASAQATEPPRPATGADLDRAAQGERLASCNWRRHQCFAAVSFNTRTGQVGWANDKRAKDTAINVAHRSCKTRSEAGEGYPGQCEKAGWVRNGCMALAVRILDGTLAEWRTAYAYREADAKAAALDKVRGDGRERIHYWLCTTRSR
ncbi:DUF4189 domain-containing protein [Nocardioides stalactiti]|uniref:DUF4189 domain-containing protein n=1 Tax=Nocardioides stalactiti TaxID=2755356 RepID=UPI00160127D0|nr:DUF4189 domain-containing protein [Nocardioides stalactiti]